MSKTKVDGHEESAYFRAINKRLRRNGLLKADLSVSDLRLLKSYRSNVDRFSPNLLIEERTVIDLNRAPSGIVSIDFKGQNIKNIKQTIVALEYAEAHNARDAIVMARRGEKSATRELDSEKKKVQVAFQKSFSSDRKAQFSGDDGIYMPDHLSHEEKQKVVKELSMLNPGGYRLTFIPENVRPQDRSALIVSAEDIEKKLRIQLEGQLSVSELDQTMMAINMRTTTPGRGEVEVLYGGLAEGNNEIQKKISKALTDTLKGTQYVPYVP